MTRLLADPLLRAWGWLVGLGLATTAAAGGVSSGAAVPVLGVLLLAVAFLKARLILGRYLGLDRAPAWRRAFLGAIAALLMLLAGLYLIPALA